MKRTITTEVLGFSTPFEPLQPEDLAGDDIAKKLFYTTHNMTGSGYVLVGRGTISIEIEDHGDIVAGQVAVLRSQLDKVRTESWEKIRSLEDKIRNLQALTYEPANDEVAA